MSSSDPTRDLCRFLSGLTYADLPASVVERAKDLLVDHVGVALRGAREPATRIVRDTVAARGGATSCTVYGSTLRLPAAAAALVNAVAAHSVSLDDMHGPSLTHPGAVVIPAALALAESLRSGPRDFLAAVVIGYEAQARIGTAARQALSRGFHPTGISGVFGAATAAAHLLGLDAGAMESAFGIALSMSSGVMQFASDPETTVKRLHAGMPAHNGIFGAELATAGMRGARNALHGQDGFLRVFGGARDTAPLTAGLGAAWRLEEVGIKLHACCRFFHSLVDALLEVRGRPGFTAVAVEMISVTAPAAVLEGHMLYRPRSTAAAQYSLPFAMAAALLLDPRDPASFGEDAMARQDVVALMDRVKATASPELEQLHPDALPARVQVVLQDGRVLEAFRPDAAGTPRFPVDGSGIEAKFRVLTDGLLTRDWQESVIAEIRGLDDAPTLSRLASLLDARGHDACAPHPRCG